MSAARGHKPKPGKFLCWGQLAVPWIAAWTSEGAGRHSYIRPVVVDGRRLRFLFDGINTPGLGKPEFKLLHNERCRAVVLQRRCQMCWSKLPAVSVCMNQGATDRRRPLINDGLPMCRVCAVLALEQCPGLQRIHATGRLHFYAASEWLLAPVLLGPKPEQEGGNPHLNALLAAERGPVFSVIKLVLTKWREISADELRGIVR